MLYVLGVGICVKQRIFAARTAVILTMEPVFAALFGYWIVDATSALNPFDLEASLRQIFFLFAGRITSSESIKVTS